MKIELAMFAEETGLEVHVSHFPSGTFRWNKIVHQLFCFTSRNWAGKTLTDINAIVSLISSEAVKSGLKVQYDTGTDRYPSGSSSADDEVMKKIDIETVGPNVSWNYIIRGFKQ